MKGEMTDGGYAYRISGCMPVFIEVADENGAGTWVPAPNSSPGGVVVSFVCEGLKMLHDLVIDPADPALT